MASQPVITEAPQRADARRNRERILDAARAVFRRHGVQAQIDDVAAHAGVGIGTVYRHFPTKDALLTAIVAEKFARFVEHADDALAEDRPWEAFVRMLERDGEVMAADVALQTALLASSDTVWTNAREQHPELQDKMQKLIDRAIAAGDMREDFSAQEVPMLMCGVTTTMVRDLPGAGWRRHLQIVLDGIRRR